VKKLFEAFFAIPEDGKVPEKVMLTRAALSVIVIVVCLAAMGITAYAYFSHSLISGQNTIQAAGFIVNVTIQNTDPNQEPVQIEKTDRKGQVATLLAGNTYSVTIERTGNASTGYCKIFVAGDDEPVYHTQQLSADVSTDASKKSAITFTLTVAEMTKISFYANWGTSSYYAAYVEDGENGALYILDGETVAIP